MDRKSVSSSMISSIGYDEDTEILEIEFGNGAVYQYFDVPQGVWTDFQNAESHGIFFNREIKDNYHPQKSTL